VRDHPMPAFQGLDKALRWLRLETKRKQREVAQAAGVTQAMLCSYEQGKRTPSLASLEKILDTLGADLFRFAEVLALVNGRPAPSPRDRAGPTLPREGPGAPRGLPPLAADPTIDLGALLGAGKRLPPEQEEAFRQIASGFFRWLRILYAVAPGTLGAADERSTTGGA
jgi:transcriptional regulator with XRE-family HTH domain